MKSSILRITFILSLGLVSLAALSVCADAQQALWKTGDVVEVEWKGKWFKAEIIKPESAGYKVHYDGYGDNFDESVEPSRVRPLEDRPAKSEKAAKVWTWTDGAGNARTKAEFVAILQRHAQWLSSAGHEGARADLTAADLNDLDSAAADMKVVNLESAVMPGVKIGKADAVVFLKNADLSGAQLFETKLFGMMEGVYLSGAFFNLTKISGTITGADLANARIVNADFTGANLAKSNLSGASIFDSNFANTFLGGADLSKATVLGGDWTDANFLTTDVKELLFEPIKTPEIRAFAGAKNLEFIRYGTSPDAVTLLRNSLRENGFDDAGRKVTYALKRRHNELYREQAGDNWVKYIYYFLNLIFFDWTVRYGLEPARALMIVLYVWLFFAAIYDLFIHFPGRSGIFLVKNRVRKNAELTSAMRVRPRVVGGAKGWNFLLHWLASEWRVLRISLFFSAARALHLGYGELDLGRWLQMLTKREYELRPKHWTRAIAGWQSLISLYLIVMWLLTEFGDPFD